MMLVSLFSTNGLCPGCDVENVTVKLEKPSLLVTNVDKRKIQNDGVTDLDAGPPHVEVAGVEVLDSLLVVVGVGLEEEALEDARLAHLARAHQHHAVPLVRVRHVARVLCTPRTAGNQAPRCHTITPGAKVRNASQFE